MALIINDECIACDACREECPTTAIEEGDPSSIRIVVLSASVFMMNRHVYLFVLLIVLFLTKTM